METRRRGNRGIEENTMAILDTSGSKGTQDLKDDRRAFLEAVRYTSIVPENGTAPTNKMFEAIFQILKDENSLDLIMTSYQLLNELAKRFPRVYQSRMEKTESPSPSTAMLEIVAEEAWSPFMLGSGVACSGKEEADKNFGGLFDSSGFHLLIQDLAKVADEAKFEALESKQRQLYQRGRSLVDREPCWLNLKSRFRNSEYAAALNTREKELCRPCGPIRLKSRLVGPVESRYRMV